MPNAITLQLQITLRHTKPRIWRRVRVSGESTLEDLHRTLQICMGWTDSHLHCFRDSDGRGFGIPEFDEDDLFGWVDERHVQVADVLAREKDRLWYEYDFGDGWEHEIKVEKRFPGTAGEPLPRCLHAVGQCPPEDVGGVSGFYAFLEAMDDARHPDHEDVVAWWGGRFDSGNPSVDAINELLETMDSVDEAIETHNTMGLEDLAGLSPEDMHGLLYQTFECPSLLDWGLPKTPQDAPMIRMVSALMEAMGEKGIKLTAKGNLPLAVVRSMIDAGDPKTLSRHPEFLARVRTEEECMPVHVARILADLSGMVHRQKGRLLLRKKAQRLADEHRWDEVYRQLLECMQRSFNWAYLDGYEELRGIQKTSPFMFWLLHLRGGDWRDESAYTEEWLKAFPMLESEAEDLIYQTARKSVSNAMVHRAFSLYRWFGLIEQREGTVRKDGLVPYSPLSVRKSELFDQVVRFR